MTSPRFATLCVFAAPHGVKVGVTTGRVELRRADVEAASGQPVTVAYTVDCDRTRIRGLERRVREALREHRTHGEWFACQPEVAVQAVKNAVSGSDAALPDPAELPSPDEINELVAQGVQPELAALRLLGGRATSRQIATALLERPPTVGETVSVGRRLHGLQNRSYLHRDGDEWVEVREAAA